MPFFEGHISKPPAVCESRDAKGLYARARSGDLSDFTGISDPYEAPVAAELVCNTEGRTSLESVIEVHGGLDRFESGRFALDLGMA